MDDRTFIRNRHTGPGAQNNNNDTGIQNINTGGHIGHMSGGSVQFTENRTAPTLPKTLQEAIAGVGASHNAEQQYSRGECLEGTREVLLEMIRDWILAKDPQRPLFWLTGAVGVGKTAIAMTVAKSCEREGRLVSSFFFFRSDPRRNTPYALILTIAYGLVTTIPFLRRPIEERISENPLVLSEATLEDQFRKLVIEPTLRWPQQTWLQASLVLLEDVWASFFATLSLFMSLDAMWMLFVFHAPVIPRKIPSVVIIDGLDECGPDDENQQRILSTIASLYRVSPSSPLQFLICSRPESTIREAFEGEPLCLLTKRITLNESFSPNSDIEFYYRHEFKKIRANPDYARIPFSDPWPSSDELEALLQRTSGQFAYATTVVRYIRRRGSSPIEQLSSILNSTPDPQRQSPLHELDCLYHTILSSHPDHCLLIPVLAAILLVPRYLPLSSFDKPPIHDFIELLLGLSPGKVNIILSPMHSVLDIRDKEITVFHTSFTDFIYDPSRSGQFHIDKAVQRDTLGVKWLRALAQQVRENPSIILKPFDERHGTRLVRLLRDNWARFCLTEDNSESTPELLLERNNLFRSILSVFPDRQQLLAMLASVILLPLNKYTHTLAFNDLLGLDNEYMLSTMKLMETCQLATTTGYAGSGLKPFFLSFLFDSSHEYHIDVLEQHNFLASRWIRALVPKNWPTPDSEEGSCVSLDLWHGWVDFCCNIKQLSDELLSDFLNLDIEYVVTSMSVICGTSSGTISRLEAIISWLTNVTGPINLIDRFKRATEKLESTHLDDPKVCSLTYVQDFSQKTSKVADSDKCLMGDIRQYYVHHLQEIVSDPKYHDIRFPSPWPSEGDLTTLVERSSGQYTCAATLIDFVKLGLEDPISQLDMVLHSDLCGVSPYHHLCVLYYVILNVNSRREEVGHSEVLLILEAILILPDFLKPTPAHIEMVLGLSSGLVDLMLRGLHSVLDIRDRNDEICLRHNPFREFLIDETRPQHDLRIYLPGYSRYRIARQWLQNLSVDKMADYSSDERINDETSDFFTAWVRFLASCDPDGYLLEDLQDIDLAGVFFCKYRYCVEDASEKEKAVRDWRDMFGVLVPWMKSCPHGLSYGMDVQGLIQKLSNPPEV
ncbi:hypothetical protein PM082_022166 [Marasmius tenuissimus]|nr:hypothetical protein PM082_022166 [Marasmius tenuissimus]